MLPLTAEAGTTAFLRQWEDIQTARYARCMYSAFLVILECNSSKLRLVASNVIIFYDYGTLYNLAKAKLETDAWVQYDSNYLRA